MFVSGATLDDAASRSALPPGRTYTAVSNARRLTSADMLHNTANPRIDAVGEPHPAVVNGRDIPLYHARHLPLTRLHHLA